MTEILVFGGTAEGRALYSLLGQRGVPVLLWVATEYGEALVADRANAADRAGAAAQAAASARVGRGRLDAAGMEALLALEAPRLVIDATHPYAAEASANIQAACVRGQVPRLRLVREPSPEPCPGGHWFPDMGAMARWLNSRPGTLFSTLGAKEAPALAAVTGFRERVWLRILPDPAGLAACLALGFPARRIVCMQGPFSAELNTALFRAARADILLTKESGRAGGFWEKITAAQGCGMAVALLARPAPEAGLTLAALARRVEEGTL